MREIKFRAWDKKENKIFNESLVIGNVGLGEGSVIVTEDVEKGNELIWMQFTGLKDKNGKEIYEGDIVKFIFDNKFVKVIVKWSEVSSGFVGSRKIRGRYIDIHSCLYLHLKNEFEVIGNIYENPELLEKK